MQPEFHNLETSLKQFLIDSNNDSYNARSINLTKYNNLKIFMEPKKTNSPHFVVRIGISEAIYRLSSCEKIAGGLGSDDRYIHRWFEKASITSALQEAWKQSQKFDAVQMKGD